MESLKGKLSNKIVIGGLVGALSVSLFANEASAELKNNNVHRADANCVLVIDKKRNDITYAKGGINYGKGKKFTTAYAKGDACKKGKNGEVSGYYYGSKKKPFASLDAIYTNKVKYSGEKTVLPTPGLKVKKKKIDHVVVSTYITDSGRKITGKKMRVVYTQSLRAKPKINSKKLKKVYQDSTTVKVKKVKGAWAYVYSYRTKTNGWMPRKYLISNVTTNKIVNKTVKPKNSYLESGSLPVGKKKLTRKGTSSKYTYIYKYKYTNGKFVSKKLYKKYTRVKGKDNIYKLGA